MSEKLNILLVQFCRTISTRKLYFSKHPKVKTLVTNFIKELREYCAENDIEKLFVGIVDGHLVFEGRNLFGPSIVGRQLIDFADKLHCAGLSFTPQTAEEELDALLNLTIDLKHPVKNINEARELLTSNNIFNIEIAHHYVNSTKGMTRDQQSAWKGQSSGNFIHSPTLIHQALFDSVAQAHEDVAIGKEIDIDNTRSVSEYMLHFIQTDFSDMMQHVYYPDSDSYTLGHSVRVAALSVFIANSFNWEKEFLLSLATAGLLHDIGKSKIPDHILYKPGRLNKEEFAEIMAHSQVGAEILMGQKNSTALDIAAAWGHHIRHDGGGYPKLPQWATRHPVTSLLQICDVFEALTATRPYKPPLSPHMAFSIMLLDKGGFHPALLASFISTLGLYPPGTIVRMSDNSQGTVATVGPEIDKPEVRITHDSRGSGIPQDSQPLINLATGAHGGLFIKELLFVSPEL